MPIGLALIHWDDSIGAILDEIYPDDDEIKKVFNTEKVLFIFTSQTMGDITTERFSALFTDEFHIACYYGGRENNLLLMLILEENETPRFFKPILKEQFYKIIQNLDKAHEIIPQLFNEIVEKASKISEINNCPVSPIIAYKISKVVKFLEKNPSTIFTPQYDYIHGVHYPKLEQIAGNSIKAEDLLKELEKQNIVGKYMVDNLVVCPSCGSSHLKTSKICPICNSSTIIEGNIIEHFKCGHIDFENEFIKNDMICMKCNLKLETEGVDYQRLGHYHYCLKCKKYFKELNEFYQSLDCKANIVKNSLSIKPIYKYYSLLRPINQISRREEFK